MGFQPTDQDRQSLAADNRLVELVQTFTRDSDTQSFLWNLASTSRMEIWKAVKLDGTVEIMMLEFDLFGQGLRARTFANLEAAQRWIAEQAGQQ